VNIKKERERRRNHLLSTQYAQSTKRPASGGEQAKAPAYERAEAGTAWREFVSALLALAEADAEDGGEWEVAEERLRKAARAMYGESGER
jgi:phage terminase small subunit